MNSHNTQHDAFLKDFSSCSLLLITLSPESSSLASSRSRTDRTESKEGVLVFRFLPRNVETSGTGAIYIYSLEMS
jgi:hypothetical protein